MKYRTALGIVLRHARMQRGYTLRKVSFLAHIALGYLSEIERGQKEVSSDILFYLCEALGWSVPDVLDEVSKLMRETELVTV